MTLYSRGSARRSLIDTVTLRAVSQISTMFGYVILVRGMTEEDFGVLSLLYAFIPVSALVASLGLEAVLRRYQPEYLRSGNSAAAAWLVRIVAYGRFLTNVVVLGAVLIGWNYIAPIFKLTPDHRSAFAIFCVLIFLHFQVSILQLALGSHMLHRYSVGSTAIMSLIKLVAYGVLFLNDALSLHAAIVSDMLAYGFAYATMRTVYRRRCLAAGGEPFRPDPAERKRLLRYGLLNNFNDAGVMLMYSTLDSFFLAAFVSTTAVGVYTFYTRLSLMVHHTLPSKLFESVIRPMFFAVRTADADRKIPTYFSFLLTMNLLVQLPAFAFALAYHAEIVEAIFGGKFVEYSWLLPLIVGFWLIDAIAEPVGLLAHYEERAGVILLSKVFVIYNIAAMALLVPTFGVYGAALAAGTAQLMKNWLIWWHVRRRGVWINWRTAVPADLLLWGTAVAIALGAKALLGAPAIIDLGVGVVVFGAVGLVYLRSPAISSSDRAILAAVTGSRAQRILRYLGLLPRA
jgi:O-antigen/teichoic acid export membrane protein